jgi:hypothetical protein
MFHALLAPINIYTPDMHRNVDYYYYYYYYYYYSIENKFWKIVTGSKI